MRSYIIKRVLLIFPSLLIVSLIVFFVVRLIPADVIDMMMAEQGAIMFSGSRESEANMRAELERRLGLDVSVPVQFGRWVGVWPQADGSFSGVFQGSLGMSLWKERPITKDVVARIPVSFELGLFGLVIAILISFPIGIYSAIRQDTVGDYIGRSLAITFIAIPSFWIGTMVVIFPSIWWGWTPPIRLIPFTADPLGNLAQFALPGAILGMALCGGTMRYLRTMMLEVLRQDYIRTAWAKGLRERVVVVRHAMKNALIPVVTLLGLMVPVLVGGTVILEQIFTLPGMGRLLLSAAFQRDYTMISAIVLIIAVVVLFSNLAVDLLYGYLDPRIRYR